MPLVSLPGGQLRDEIRNPLYDSIDLLAAVSPVGLRTFFSSITNADGSPKGLDQTNLKQANSLPTATSFRCQGYAVDAMSYFDGNRLALPIITDYSSIQLTVGEKQYAQLPWAYIGGRVEVSGAAAATTAPATTIDHAFQKLGQSAVAPVVLTGKHVIDILPIQQFSAQWNCAVPAALVASATLAADTRIRFYFSMKGLLRRAVQ